MLLLLLFCSPPPPPHHHHHHPPPSPPFVFFSFVVLLLFFSFWMTVTTATARVFSSSSRSPVLDGEGGFRRKTGSNESHFNVSRPVRGKVTGSVNRPQLLKRKASQSGKLNPRRLLTNLTPYRWAKPAHPYMTVNHTHIALNICLQAGLVADKTGLQLC